MDLLLDDIPKLQRKYRFILKKYDINYPENYKLLEKMEEKVSEIGEDLPIIFIGDSVFYGPARVRGALESTLKILTVSSGSPLPDTTEYSQDTTIPPLRSDSAEIHLSYFYQPRCRECNRTASLLNALKKYHQNLIIHEYNLFDPPSKILLEALARRNRIPDEKRLIVPSVVIGDDYLIKEEITMKKLDSLITRYKSGGPELDSLTFSDAEKSILERFSHFSIVGILVAGLLDGVNPCAFATLIFFVSYLLFIGRRRRDVILMAVFFILGVFISYLAIGFGAFNILKYVTKIEFIGRIIFLGFGIIALILGVLSFRDYVMAKRGALHKMILQLPLGIKQRIHKDIKARTATSGIIIGSLITGLFISLLEFGCTGQVYLPTITFMITKAGAVARPVIALILYNLMFILPLVVIALFATLFSNRRIAQTLEKNIPLIKFLTALLFFGLGILLIVSAW